MPDVDINDCGSVVMITPITPAGREWVEENIEFEPWQAMGCSIACEPRCVPTIVQGLQDAGLQTD